jgi:general secretion pathway protein F
MPMFAYLAYNAAGEHVDGSIEAGSPGQAADALHNRGLLAYRTTLVASQTNGTTVDATKASPLSLAEFATFARQLATLLQAELPVDQCLRIIASQAPKQRTGQFAMRLGSHRHSGTSALGCNRT